MKKLILNVAVLAASLLVAFDATAAKTKHGVEYDTSGVRLGYWTRDFQAAKKMAESQNIPMICVWGSDGCGWCGRFQEQGLLKKDVFKNWTKQANHQIVMMFYEEEEEKARGRTEVKDFVQGATSSEQKDWRGKALTEWPFIRLYWKKSDGTTLSVRFTGRDGWMPVDEGSTAEQLVATLDRYFGSYVPKPDYNGGYFSVTNLPAARLEAVAGKTTFVNIPMFRTEKAAAKNKLQIDGGSLIEISWAANEVTKSYKYAIPATAKAGTSIALKLYADDGKTLKSTSAINVVAVKANAIGNPKWIGESFSVGEWTMDLDAALAKAKTYTLAVVGGDMWCPYCQGLRDDVLSKAEFVNWAKQNNVNLVCIDMPQKGKTTATLLTRDASTAGASGAAYLSRNMISDADAKVVFDRNKTLSGFTWLPKSSSATRLGNPTVLLLNSDKTVAARLCQANDGKAYPLAETLNRLRELLKLNGGKTDERSDLATTKLKMKIGEPAHGQLQVNEGVHYYKLENVPQGKVVFTSSCKRALTLSVIEYAGSGTDIRTLATDSESVLVTFTDSANKYLKVEGFVPKTNIYGTGTETDYTISSALTLIPAETKGTYTCAGGEVFLQVVKDVVYKLKGFSGYAAFTQVGDGLYRARETASLKMTCEKNANLVYQVWRPGVVQFDVSSGRVMEKDGRGTISVTRENGASGSAKVSVTIDKGARSTERVTLVEKTFVWAEGESGSKTLHYAINVNPAYDADEKYSVTLTADPQSDAKLGANATFQLTLSDTDDPVFNADDFSEKCLAKMPFSKLYPVNNIKENKRVKVSVESGKLPSGLSLSYDYASKSVILSGKPKAGKATFTLAVTETRSGKKAIGRASKFVFNAVDAGSLKPGDEFYNAAIAQGKTIDCIAPLYGLYNGYDVLAGTIEVKISKSYRVTAKYKGSDKSVTFSGDLPTIAADGVCSGSFTKKNARMSLTIDADGKVYATVSGVQNVFGKALSSPDYGIRAIQSGFSNYAGYYTVSLPAYAEGLQTVPTGTGYLTLKMDSSSFSSKGKVRFTGVLADGKGISGSASFIPDAWIDGDGVKYGAVPVFVSKSTGSLLSTVLFVKRNAKAEFTTDPRAVIAEPASSAYWRSNGEFAPLDVYGSYYQKKIDLVRACNTYCGTTTFNLVCDTSFFANSEKYGELKAVSAGLATLTSKGKVDFNLTNPKLTASLKVSPSTGVVTGKVTAEFANGRKQKLTVKGVILLGWSGCSSCREGTIHRPVISAAAYYSDSVNRKTAKRGFAVELQDLE